MSTLLKLFISAMLSVSSHINFLDAYTCITILIELVQDIKKLINSTKDNSKNGE